MTLDLNTFYREIILYFHYHTYIAVTLAGVLLLLMFQKPKLFFTLIMIVVINISLLYVISNISSLGELKKQHLIQKSTFHVQADLS